MSLIKRSQSTMFAFSSSHQGASHKRNGKVCQDAAYARYKKGDRYAVAIVSDGHGGNNYFRSDRGARFAIESAKVAINHFMRNFKGRGTNEMSVALKQEPNAFLKQLEQNIIYKWREQAKKDYYQTPFTDAEIDLMSDEARKNYYADADTAFIKAYGATLIAVVICPDKFWFGLHIGDGKCVAFDADGVPSQPIPWDDRCFLNVTTSLCDDRPLESFRHCIQFGRFPSALFVGSDGVDDCFANDADLYSFYKEVIRTFREKPNDEAYKEVDAFLPMMSEKGSGDDISVSGVIHINMHR